MATTDRRADSGALQGLPTTQYEVLRHVATAVANGAEAASVFHLVAEGAATLVGADGCGVVRFNRGVGHLVGRWARPGLVAGDVPSVIPLDGDSAVARVARTGRAARVSDYGDLDDERGQYLAAIYRNGVAVPVRLGAGIWGAVAVGASVVDALPVETEARLADFAELVALAVASPDPASREGIETLLDTLLSSAPVGIAFFDRDLRFVRVNRALAEINGRPAEDHIGLTLAELDPAFPDQLIHVLAEVRDRGVPVLDIEVSGETPAHPGVLRNWLASYYPVRTEHGIVIGVGAIVVEVTAAKRAEEELRRERDYSAALIEAMQDGLAVAAPDGTLIDVNHRFCEMTGFDSPELIECSPPYPYWSNIPGELMSTEEAFAQALAGRAGEHDLMFQRKDGSRLPVVVAHAPLRDADGELRGYVATVRDVTERHHADEERAKLLAAERAARDRTELLQAVTAALSNALTPEDVLDAAAGEAFGAVGAPRGTVLLVEGDALVSARNVDLDVDGVGAPVRLSLDGDSPLARVASDGAARFYSTRPELAAALGGSLARVRRDTAAMAIVPLAIEGRTLGVLGFSFPSPRPFPDADRALFATVGALCAQALERARLYEREHANAVALRERDALKSAVLRGVSHEFRTPLTAIANAAGAIERVDASERGELLAVVAAETRRLDRLVANVLDLSRLEGGVLEPRLDWCAADELIAGALEAAATLTDGVRIEVDAPHDLPLVRADPVLTERILLNLLHNAVRHGAAPVRLEVRLGVEHVDFAVIDHGAGVPSAVLRSIFEPFVGVAEHGGLGLGLGLSRGLAEAQGGTLRLDPTATGARFVLSIPVDEWVDE